MSERVLMLYVSQCVPHTHSSAARPELCSSVTLSSRLLTAGVVLVLVRWGTLAKFISLLLMFYK